MKLKGGLNGMKSDARASFSFDKNKKNVFFYKKLTLAAAGGVWTGEPYQP